MKKRLLPAFFILFFCLLPVAGEAFVPKTPHLLYLVMKKIKQPVGIQAFQTKKILNYEQAEKDIVELEEKLSYRFPEQLRSEVISGERTGFSVESDSKFVKVMDDVIVSRKKSITDSYTDILLYRDSDRLAGVLAFAGVDISHVTFERYNDTICYVIGSPLEKQSPFSSLWIEKDTLLPQKFVIDKNGWVVEFFYKDWQQISKTWYPMQISIFLDNRLFAMVLVNKVELTSNISPSLFDIDRIEHQYLKNDPGLSDENTRQVEELDKSIEEFKQLYEQQ